MGYSITGPGTPPSSPGTITGADNGVGVFSGNVELGDPYLAFTNVSKLLVDRALDMSSFFIKWVGSFSGTCFTDIFFNDQDGYLVVENDEFNSPIPQTETGFKNRTNPTFLPPFDGAYQSIFGQRYTGELFIRAIDNNAIATGTNHIVFETKTVGGGISERARITAAGNMLIGKTLDTGQRLQVQGVVFFSNDMTFDTFGGARLVSGQTLVYQSNSATLQHHFVNQQAGGFIGTLMFVDVGGTVPSSTIFSFIANSAVPGNTAFAINTFGRVIIGGIADNGSTLQIGGDFTTKAPTGGVSPAGATEIGSEVIAPVVLDNTKYLEITNNGTLYKVLVGV